MKFENVLALGGLAVLVAIAAAAYRIADKLDERHIDHAITAITTMITIIVLGTVITLCVLAYLRRRNTDREYSQRGQGYGHPVLPAHGQTPRGYQPALPADRDDQGSFVVRDEFYAHQEEWR